MRRLSLNNMGWNFAGRLFFAAAFFFTQHSLAQSGPSSINVSGGLFQPNGTPLVSASVGFNIDIYDSSGTCLLYSESHPAQNLSDTKGGFSLEVGKGLSPTNYLDVSSPSAMSSKVYENTGVVAGGWPGCASGTTLADGDQRMIRVTYDLGSGPVVMTPDVPVAAAAYAIVAQTLQGKRPSDFLQVRDDVPTDLSQANLENIFSASNYTKLNSLVNGSSTQYMVSSPSAAVGFNGQRITNVATPSASGDAATKGYADGAIGGKTADVTGVGPALGNGYTLIWDQAGQKWTTGVPSAIDNTKLPLAGGTMTGALDMGGQDVLATGHITMSAQKVFNLGTFDDSQETALVATLLPAQTGASWYNSQANVMKVWDGTTAISQAYLTAGKLSASWLPNTTVTAASYGSATQVPTFTVGADGRLTAAANVTISGVLPGGAAGGDLTGTYPNPTIGTDKVISSKIDNANIGINKLVMTDGATGTTLKFSTCALNEVLRFEGATGWVCRDPSAIVSFPVTSVNTKTGAVVLDANDLGLGTAALENVGTGSGNVPQLDAGGKIPTGMIPAPYLVDGGNSRGAALSIGSNDNFAVNFRTNNTDKMIIDAAGNVGIGTATAARLLHVNGPMRIAPAALPSSPAAGELAFDSGSANALKFYDGSAWQSVGTGNGNGDFLKNGSIAMTGALQMGSQSITGVGANITSSAALTIANTGANSLSLSSNGTNATAVNIAVAGVNGGITLAPNGTGVVTSARPMVITPSTVPASTAGTIFFDSAASNAMKYFDGSAWVSIGSGTGDFLKNGTIAMTGALQMGSQNITGVGTNITATAGVTVAQAAGSAMVVGSNSGASTMTVNSGTGGLNVTGTGTTTVTSSKVAAGATILSSTGGTTATTLITSNGTGADAVNLTSTGANSGITLAPNGTGVVTSSRPVVITPTAASPNTAGAMWFDSGASNALKYHNGSAWVSVGSGTGDFLKNGTVAMTGNFDAGTNNLNNIGAINGAAGLAVSQSSGSALTLGNSGGASSAVLQSGTGNVTVNGAGVSTLNSSKVAAGATVVSSTGGTTATTLITSNGTSASAVNITSTGANSGITLAPNGTGVVTSSRPLTITPSTVPTSTTGTIFFDSAASNAMKYFDGSAWVSVGSGTGDFLKNGSIAMTGALQMGSQNITGVGSNLNGAGSLNIASAVGTTLTLGNSGASSVVVLSAPTVQVGTSAGQAVLVGAATGAASTSVSGGTGGITLSSLGTAANSVQITSTGANGGITLTPNGTGVVTTARPVVITPTAASPNTAGALWFDSGASNALKFYDGAAWQTVGTGNGDFLRAGTLAMTGDFNAGGYRVLGNTTASANLELESTSSGTKGYVLLQKNGGNVGIGTTTPAAKIQIQGDGTTPNIRVSDGSGFSRLGFGSAYNLFLTNESNVVQTLFSSLSSGNSYINTTGGNVGIGTTIPAQTLSVQSAGVNTFSARTSGGGGVYLLNSNPTLAFNNIWDGTAHVSTETGKYGFRMEQTAGRVDFITSSNAPAAAAAYTYNAPSLSLNSNGNVGIGTTVPISALNVAGTTDLTWSSTVTGLATIGTGGSTGSLFVNTPSLNSTYHSGFGVNGTYASQTSVVNIGAYGVNSAGGYGSNLAFSTTKNAVSTEAMRITKDGNVGIGTTTPGSKLEVIGNTNINGRIISTKPAGGTVQDNASNAVDWNNGNYQTSSYNCALTTTFSNMTEGGSYTLIVTDTSTTQCNFGDGGSTFYYSPSNTTRTGATRTIYTFLKAGGAVYVTWVPGFQ